MRGHAPIEGFHPEGDAALAVRSTYSDAHGGARIHAGRRVHDDALRGQSRRGRARRLGPEHGGDAALRELDEPVRDDVRASADRARGRLPGADLHARPRIAVRGPPDARHLPRLADGRRRLAQAARGDRPGVRRRARRGAAARRTGTRSRPRRCVAPGRSRRSSCSASPRRSASSERRSSTPSGPTTGRPGSRSCSPTPMPCWRSGQASSTSTSASPARARPARRRPSRCARSSRRTACWSRIRSPEASTPRSPSGSCAPAAPRRPTWRRQGTVSGSRRPRAHHDGRHGCDLGGRRHHRLHHRHRRALTEPRPPRARVAILACREADDLREGARGGAGTGKRLCWRAAKWHWPRVPLGREQRATPALPAHRDPSR